MTAAAAIGIKNFARGAVKHLLTIFMQKWYHKKP
jgi:hypothetical protein